jgi:hypothetical protein
MKYVSFSLWGNNPIYNVGIIRNAELMDKYYSDWEMVVFFDDSVPEETIKELQSKNVKTRLFVDKSIYGMFWRFYALDLPDCEYAIFRDADSRISMRESLAVDEWIRSGKSLHVMRDHPYHRIPAGNNQLGILGGMWGIKNGVLPITEMIYKFNKSKEHNYGNDQTFLKSVYSALENDRCTHDDFFEKKPFPIYRDGGRFVGERINVDETPVNDDWKKINSYYENR